MPYVHGFLKIAEGADRPTDPDYGIDAGGRPTNPIVLPPPPPGIWPPPTAGNPIVPIRPPTVGGGPVLPPGMIWPPVWWHGDHAGHPLPPGGVAGHPPPLAPVRPGQGLPKPPAGSGGTPGHDLPVRSETFVVLCGIPGIGWRYVVVNPSLTVGYPEVPEPK